MEFSTSTPEMIALAMVDALRKQAAFKAVEGGARRAAGMLAALL